MSESVYALLAYIARYWFLALLVVIIWRAIVWLRMDANRLSRVRRRLPDAGYIGEWVVVATESPYVPEGTVLRAPRDGWIGSNRACDVRLKDAGAPARAARFYLRRDGLHVFPQRSGILLVDGEAVRREAVLRHGATLTVGGVTLQLRLFAGMLLTGETTESRQQQDREAVTPASEPAEGIQVETGDDTSGPPKLELPKPALMMKKNKRRRT